MENFLDLYGKSIFILLVGISIVAYILTKKNEDEGDSMKKSFFSGKFSKTSITPLLDTYTTDFTELARTNKIDPVIGRKNEVIRLSQILSRKSKNNAILVGEPGVGKTAIVEALAQRIVTGEVTEILQEKRLLSLDVANLLSGTKYRGEFEKRAKQIVQEISNSNRSIILFIDEVHQVIQSQGTEGSVNFSDILKPALARGDLQMVGATTIKEYNKYIKTDAALERRFQPVQVDQSTVPDTIAILKGVKDKYRDYHKVEFTDAALETAATLTEKKIKYRTLPDKALDAIDEAASMIRVSHIHGATSAMLYQAAAQKYPKLAKMWKEAQILDTQIFTANKKHKIILIKKLDNLETEMEKMGLHVVDSKDIEKVVNEWTTQPKA